MEDQTTQTPIQEPITNSAPASIPSPKDNHTAMIVSMAVFVLLSLGAVAFLYYQNQQLKGMLASYQTIPTASPTPTATPDPTADWKTYTNTQLSFKYPSDLVYCSNYGGSAIQLWPAPFPCLDGVDGPSEISVLSYKSGEYQSYKKSSSSKKIEIGGIESTENIIKYDETDGPWQSLGGATEIIVPIKTGLIQILLQGEKPEQKIRFNQILATFRFTEATSSASPTPAQKACTMEAKLCPNGSYVGRTGPNCEFTACPQ